LFEKPTSLGQEYRETVKNMLEMKNTLSQIESRIDQNGGINCGWISNEHSLFTQIAFRF
jgi:hypothetical protein